MTFVIHVGIPKSGTTFLQTQVFDRVGGLRCIGRPHNQSDDYRRFRHAVMLEEDEGKAREAIASFFEKARESHTNEPLILSEEAICFAPLWHVAARRLAEGAPDAKILFTLRNQFTAATSFYANHGRFLRNVPDPYRGRHVSFDAWLRFAEKNVELPYLKNYLRVLYFDRLAGVFATYFGDDRLCFLFYEDMIQRRDTFAKDLSAILGTDCRPAFEAAQGTRANPRSSSAAARHNALRSHLPFLARALRAVPGGGALNRGLKSLLEKGAPAKVEMTDAQRASLASLYRDSNRRLAARFDLPLGDQGYPL